MSTQVIDALLVTLGLDPADFNKNSAKAVKEAQALGQRINRTINDRNGQEARLDTAQKKRQKEAEERNKKTVDGFKTVRNEVIKLTGLFMAGVGIKDFFANTINGAANLGYLSANLSMSTERITAFQRASERAGGSTEGLTAQLKESVDTLAQLRLGMGPNEGLQWFFRLGGSSAELKDGNTYLMARAKIVQEMFAVDPGKAALIAKQMGISEDQFNFIKQGPQAILAMVAAQEKNTTVTKEDAAAALELKNNWLDFTQSLQTTAMSIILALAPAISAVMQEGVKWADSIGKNKAEIRQFGEAIAKFITTTDFSKLSADAKEFASSVASIAKSIKDVIDRWDEWTGRSKVATPGVTKLPGALRIGQKEDLDKDNVATGKPVKPAEKQNEILKAISSVIEEGFARTMASFGNEAAGKWVLNKTGHDDYLVAPGARGGLSSKESLRQEAARQWKAADLPPKAASDLFGSLERQHALPAGILDSVWSAESSRGKNMLSPKGAMGHFGFMPNTAKEFGLKDPNDLGQSADAAARKLAGLIKQYKGDTSMALAAYNYGQGNVAKSGMGNLPAETSDYVMKIAQSMASNNARSAANMSAGAGASAAAPATNVKSSTSTSEVNIHGGITINTKATDADGIARSIKPGIEKYNSSMQANTGVN